MLGRAAHIDEIAVQPAPALNLVDPGELEARRADDEQGPLVLVVAARHERLRGQEVEQEVKQA